MHSGNIENYNFIHGLHRNLINGKWFPLHPHTLGRPLTHDEMDYNLLYSQQTVAGWRIFGQNDNLTLSDNELRKSLIFWKISADDVDYARYVAAGYTVDQYIWITPTHDCNDFMVSSESTTDTSLNTICDAFVITLSSTSPTIDSCDIFGVNSQGATDSVGYVPGYTATPEPTAVEPTTPLVLQPQSNVNSGWNLFNSEIDPFINGLLNKTEQEHRDFFCNTPNIYGVFHQSGDEARPYVLWTDLDNAQTMPEVGNVFYADQQGTQYFENSGFLWWNSNGMTEATNYYWVTIGSEGVATSVEQWTECSIEPTATPTP